jgi:LAO/AO transport system kinase
VKDISQSGYSVSGEMAEKRRTQAFDWMDFLLHEGLRQWFYSNPHVRNALPTLRRNVEEQKISPTAAADSLPAFLNNQDSK